MIPSVSVLAALLVIGAWMQWRLFGTQDPTAPKKTFQPRPRWILAIKAVVAIIVALQLIHPMLARIPKPWAEWQVEEIIWDLEENTLPWLATVRAHSLNRIEPVQESPDTLKNEALWLLSIFLMIIVTYLVEYEWIVRPSTLLREDSSLNQGRPPPWTEWIAPSQLFSAYTRRQQRRYAELTFPWIVYRSWLPVLVVKVNLGFEKLDHRRVVQAMLAGLRDRYSRMFLSWNSGLANLGRFLGLICLVFAVHLASEMWFQPEKFEEEIVRFKPCQDPAELSQMDRLICRWGGVRLLDTLYLRVLPLTSSTNSPGPYIRFYHVLLFVVFLVIGRWLLRRIPVLPYAENLRRIDDLLESLSSRRTMTSKKNLWKPAQWIYGFFVDDSVRQTERDPVDPRTVEIAFLKILDDIQRGNIQLPGVVQNNLSIPVPEITFVFDELDKLGTRVKAEDLGSPLDIPDAERQRSRELKALMSDLKNILSSGPARFVFVGGRNLHDEWLADQTARQPLLSNIFNAEIHLPSLMLDHRRVAQWQPGFWINRYLYHQHRRAQFLYAKWARRQWRPPMSLSVESPRPATFAPLYSDGRSDFPTSGVPIWNCSRNQKLKAPESVIFLQGLIDFLTYRSKGNPKRLKDLFSTFVRPVGRVVDGDLRWEHFHCKHVLQFNDDALFRIQLLVDLYQHVVSTLEVVLLERDDKLAISVFQMVDFILKFHRRAFAWRNLEGAEELTHIHRAPALRRAVGELVENCSERFLHRVANGMYDFRFRSDLAREVEYISRRSADEMAAFNFTLDESQSLKTLYLDALRSKEEREISHERVTALGELHEFDQEYELARQYYRWALKLVDTGLKSEMSGSQEDEEIDNGSLLAILEGSASASKYARFSMTWGVVRLRLMLQIGMTFEHTRDLKRAIAEYAGARTLASALLERYVTSIEEQEARSGQLRLDFRAHMVEDFAGRASQSHRLHEVKQFDIFFQPVFAEAWALEKLPGTLDTGHSLVEEELWRLRMELPFVKNTKLRPARRPTDMQHSNFGLVMSRLHIRAGDMFFFKGRQAISFRDIFRKRSGGSTFDPNVSFEGYLLQAHYHYAVGLHDLKYALRERQLSSSAKLNIVDENAWTTIRCGNWPDLFSRAIGNGFDDVAEATLARTSFFGLLGQVADWTVPGAAADGSAPDCISLHASFVKLCNRWLERDSFEEVSQAADEETAPFEPGKLDNWLGEWIEDPDMRRRSGRLIRFESADTPVERLFMTLHMGLAGAHYQEHGGYPEDAAREYLQICEIVTHYLWWRRGVEVILEWRPEDLEGTLPENRTAVFESQLWKYLVEIGCWTIQKADQLFRQSRRDDPAETAGYLVGRIIPPVAVTLACSLDLASQSIYPDPNELKDKLEAPLLKRWCGKEWPGKEDFHENVRCLLDETVRRHPYPMINRLQGLKVLIDDAVFHGDVDWTSAQVPPALGRALELLDLKEQFKAPLHFTPLDSAITLSQLWLHFEHAKVADPAPELRRGLRRIYRAGRRDLSVSAEMCTMRRAFYLAISDLFYLYDDFNDRQIHFNHAMQMAGSEWLVALNELIGETAPVHVDEVLDPESESSAAANVVSPGPEEPPPVADSSPPSW